VQLWTIGHSTRSFDEFRRLLQLHEIAALADVRRFPGSRRHPQFNQLALAESLGEAQIQYFHFPELGGRRPARADSPNTAWRNAAFRGYADYMMTEAFVAGVQHLPQLAAAKRTVIMCAEALWWQCHRALIADYLKVMSCSVYHILSATKTEPHRFTAAARLLEGKLSYSASPEQGLLSDNLL